MSYVGIPPLELHEICVSAINVYRKTSDDEGNASDEGAHDEYYAYDEHQAYDVEVDSDGN